VEKFAQTLNGNPDFVRGVKMCIESLDKDVTNSIFWALNSLSMCREGSEILIKSEFIKNLKDYIDTSLKELNETGLQCVLVNQLIYVYELYNRITFYETGILLFTDQHKCSQTFSIIEKINSSTELPQDIVLKLLKELIGFLRNISRNENGRSEIVKLEIPLHCSK